MNAGMKTSDSQEWETPDEILDLAKKLAGVDHFTLDVCATASNAKARRFYTAKENGLGRPWAPAPGGEQIVWMNPPYGRTIGRWVAAGYNAALRGATVVALLPARTDTAWFHDHVCNIHGLRCDKLLFLKGRVAFKLPGREGRSQAPFPSMLVVWTPARKLGLTR